MTATKCQLTFDAEMYRAKITSETKLEITAHHAIPLLPMGAYPQDTGKWSSKDHLQYTVY